MKYLPCVEMEAGAAGAVDSAVIWLHGLGADGHDFAPLVPQLRLPEGVRTRFVFPHAPKMPVTINGGYVMPAWYDILEMSIDRRVDVAQLSASSEAVQGLIQRELDAGVRSERIVLAGFSQGGAVAYEAGLSFDKPLAGLLILSSYLATRDSIALHAANRKTPILIEHGTRDPVVPEALGAAAYEWLREKGYAVRYQTYPMEHGVCPQQVGAISEWLQERLKKG
ncbi:alpha/beta hydrolase [Marinimicrobium alkaliphilum]|uniref:alpha/beta hydrolase n=1 Tax=Marinimicrobium alkaliphilum TaxID=2202654 RepID=UPI000DBA3ACB|nr:alpha/beta fold hydrolase [Marinimicrobium alkaliphilum]